MGWWRAISTSILARNPNCVALSVKERRSNQKSTQRGGLQEWVDDLHSIDHPAVLHVLGEQHAASGLHRAAQDQSVPKRESMEAMQVNGGENVCDDELRDLELRKDFNPSPGQFRIEFEFSRGRDEVLLQHLE